MCDFCWHSSDRLSIFVHYSLCIFLLTFVALFRTFGWSRANEWRNKSHHHHLVIPFCPYCKVFILCTQRLGFFINLLAKKQRVNIASFDHRSLNKPFCIYIPPLPPLHCNSFPVHNFNHFQQMLSRCSLLAKQHTFDLYTPRATTAAVALFS